MKNILKLPSLRTCFFYIIYKFSGVIWLRYKTFPGASACINTLQQNGKKVHYVSNNSVCPIEIIKEKLVSSGIDTDNGNIITPITAIIAYLKQIQFNKPMYVIALNSMKDTLRKEGFIVIEGVSFYFVLTKKTGASFIMGQRNDWRNQ